MSIEDVIKKSFLESFGKAFSLNGILTMLLALVVALAFGLIICLIYHKFYRGVVYSRSFAVTLVGMTVMTAMVTLAISTNIVISLGMVGALSIVRYRTAIKEPLDLLYLFWGDYHGNRGRRADVCACGYRLGHHDGYPGVFQPPSRQGKAVYRGRPLSG